MAIYPNAGNIISNGGVNTGDTAVESLTGFWQLGGRERRRDHFAGRGRRLSHVGSCCGAVLLRGRHAERGEAGGGPEQAAGGARHRVLKARRPGEKLR